MQWDDSAGAGFSSKADVPIGSDYKNVNWQVRPDKFYRKPWMITVIDIQSIAATVQRWAVLAENFRTSEQAATAWRDPHPGYGI